MRVLLRTITVTVVAMVYVIPAHATTRLPRIQTADRAAVIASFAAEFNRAEPDSGWTGNVNKCTAGTTSDAFQMRVLQRVNWYRDLAGLPGVTLDTTKTAYAQAGALISAANKKLTHTPDASSTCYTSGGYTGTSSSNLALGSYGLRAIDNYIRDDGDNNAKVGHRRWILYPMLGSVATGDIPTGTQANALYVFTEPISRVNPRDGAVAWPPAGYVPDRAVFTRWSYDRYGADFTNAQVSVIGATGAVSTTIVDRDGFIDPGIVFQPQYLNPTVNKDVTYTVNITGIGGIGDSSISYSVTLVHGNWPPAFTGLSETRNLSVCTTPGKNLATFDFVDAENEPLSYSVTGTDATYFTINNLGEVRIARLLDPNRTSYGITIVATDPQGASTSSPFLYDFTSLAETLVCPPLSITTTAIARGVTVTWTAAATKAAASYLVIVRSHDTGSTYRECTTSGTGCSVRGLTSGTYDVTVRGFGTNRTLGGVSTDPITVSITGNESAVSKISGEYTVNRGGRLPFATISSGIKGKKTYSATGGCRIDRAARFVTAPSQRASCFVVIQYGQSGTLLTRRVKITVT